MSFIWVQKEISFNDCLLSLMNLIQSLSPHHHTAAADGAHFAVFLTLLTLRWFLLELRTLSRPCVMCRSAHVGIKYKLVSELFAAFLYLLLWLTTLPWLIKCNFRRFNDFSSHHYVWFELLKAKRVGSVSEWFTMTHEMLLFATRADDFSALGLNGFSVKMFE